MALAVHRHGRCEDDDDVYAGTDTAGIEVVSAGSVTSFVRKLFQMVQGECDSIVGFVADGTAFEVKDPRRLEQDILPKYFRHSRFQSLVRQLNFYSFKKISKERSVWIYKHAFFRRDEPELLHALKRKTNQHGTPGPIGRVSIGGGGADGGDDMMAGRSPVVDRSLSRDAHDHNKPRSRGPMFLPRHGVPGSDFPTQHHNHHPHHISPSSFSNHQHQYHNTSSRTHPRPPQHPVPAPRKSGGGSGRMYHASSSRSTGGGPSTGGGAVPSYGGQGPSSRGGGGAPGGWAGAGGRPVSSGGGQGGPGAEYERRNGGGGGGGGSGMAHHQAYRQGPAMGDTGGERGALGPHGGNRGPATLGAAVVSSDKEQALAIWGLSALCQVASSATEAPLVDDEARGRATAGGSRRLSDDRGRQQQKRHRGAGPASAPTAAHARQGWGVHDESSGGDDEEEDVTSAERDDSSSSIHRRSPSNSSCASSSSSLVSSADSIHSNPRYERRQNAAADRGKNDDGKPTTTGTRAVSQQQRQQQQRTSGSGGVFCPTWDWGKAACEPAIRLPGSFVDRHFEEVDEQAGDGVDMDDVEEQSSKTEEEDMGEDQEEDADQEDEEPRKPDAKKAARGEKTMGLAEVPPSLEETRSTAPVTTTTTAITPQPRDLKADVEAETKVGLEGIGALFDQFCSAEDGGSKHNTNASESVFLATVTNSGDGGLREMSVFCAGPAGKAPDEASPSSLVRQVSLFLQSEVAVAQDLRVYAEALDPAAVDVVVGRTKQRRQGQGQGEEQPLSTDSAKLLRVFCRYAACRLGRALEVASCAAAAAAAPPSEDVDDEETAARKMLLRQSSVAQRIAPRLDQCRWKWWRAAVRFS